MTCDGSCAEPKCSNGMPLIDWDNPITEPEPRRHETVPFDPDRSV